MSNPKLSLITLWSSVSPAMTVTPSPALSCTRFARYTLWPADAEPPSYWLIADSHPPAFRHGSETRLQSLACTARLMSFSAYSLYCAGPDQLVVSRPELAVFMIRLP